jgi:hypothetical protein
MTVPEPWSGDGHYCLSDNATAVLSLPSAVDPPVGERAGIGAAMTHGPQLRPRTLAVPVAVCSACLGRR